VTLAIMIPSTAGVASASRSPSLTGPTAGIASARLQPHVRTQPLQALAANTDTALCLTPPGVACYVWFLTSKGTTLTTFYFSDGTQASLARPCVYATCSFTNVGYPNSPTREATFVAVTGQNVSIIATGPYFG
jgi:hypothetical protein